MILSSINICINSISKSFFSVYINTLFQAASNHIDRVNFLIYKTKKKLKRFKNCHGIACNFIYLFSKTSNYTGLNWPLAHKKFNLINCIPTSWLTDGR